MWNDALDSDLLSAPRKHREHVVGDTEALQAPISRNFKTGRIDLPQRNKRHNLNCSFSRRTSCLLSLPAVSPLKSPFALSLSVSSFCVLLSHFLLACFKHLLLI